MSPTFARVSARIPLDVYAGLRALLRYREHGYQHTPEHKFRGWDGYRPLHAPIPGGLIFPAGLTARVVEAAGKLGTTATIETEGTPLAPDGPPSPFPDGSTLFDDQEEAVRLAIERQRGLWALGTNFGKTITAAGLLQAYRSRRALYLLDSADLMDQTVRVLEEKLREPVGVLGDGRRPRGSPRILVAMIQTLRARHQRPEVAAVIAKAEVLIVDEVHTVTPTWFPILGGCPAKIRVGMSGSVFEAHAPLLLEAFFGPVLLHVPEKELVDAGRSSVPIILMPYAGSLTRESQEFADVYQPAIVRNESRNAIIVESVDLLREYGLRTLVLFYSIEHGEAITRSLRERGIRVHLLNGTSPIPERKEALVGLAERRLDAIVASTIFNKGIDTSAFEGFVNAAAWKSGQATGQKLGRGFRLKLEGPNRFFVIDPHDLANRTVKRHSQIRFRFYSKRGFKVEKGSWEEIRAHLRRLLDAEREGKNLAGIKMSKTSSSPAMMSQ